MDQAKEFLEQMADPASRTWPASGTASTTSTWCSGSWLVSEVRLQSDDVGGVSSTRVRRPSGPAVADELGMPENAVLLAKARVIRRLREEAGDLLH